MFAEAGELHKDTETLLFEPLPFAPPLLYSGRFFSTASDCSVKTCRAVSLWLIPVKIGEFASAESDA